MVALFNIQYLTLKCCMVLYQFVIDLIKQV
nr:MAG TPA: hypothetical protein [Caudoviricetes sp.]